MAQKGGPCYSGQQLLDNAPCQAAVNPGSRALLFSKYRALLIQCRLYRHASGSPSGATTTTAASGGNRESLLGQRPARRAQCATDAGCRNPALSSVSETERLIHSTEPASIFIVKDLSGKNHVLLLHFNEKLQKIPAGAVRRGCRIKISDELQLRQKFFQNRKSIV